MTKEQKCYMEAYGRIVREAERDGAEKAIEFAKRRSITGAPPHIDKPSEHEFVHNAKQTMLQTVLILTMVTLHDEFDFGHDRLLRFKKRFQKKSECLADDDEVNWKMMQEILMDECHLETDLIWAIDGKDPTER